MHLEWARLRARLSAVAALEASTGHVAKDILRNGPARLYWCFPFEGFYRRVKHWAEHSNRKSELMHIATMLSLQKAVELTERAKDGA